MSNQRVQFRLIAMPCCAQLLCWVNPRFPNYCPECGKYVFDRVKGCVVDRDDNAWLRLSQTHDVENSDG